VNNMTIRVIVAVLFGPLIILISYLGGNYLFGMILLFGAIGIGEYLWRNLGKRYILFWVLTYLFVLAMLAAAIKLDYSYGAALLAGYFLIIGMLLSIRSEEPAELFKTMTVLLWGTVYIGLLYPFLYLIRDFTEIGGDWMLFLFGSLWLSDSMAMWIGKGFGKSKLAPTVSPNKTVAGFVGGLTGGIIVAVILGFWRLSQIPLPYLIIAGLLISFVGQLGDLVESMWKRAIGIKDSSKIIPGHGGVLDRFDSTLFAAPTLFVFLKYFVYN